MRIFGEAKHDFYKDFYQNVRDKSVLLLYVEGSEFEILSADVFIAFKKVNNNFRNSFKYSRKLERENEKIERKFYENT